MAERARASYSKRNAQQRVWNDAQLSPSVPRGPDGFRELLALAVRDLVVGGDIFSYKAPGSMVVPLAPTDIRTTNYTGIVYDRPLRPLQYTYVPLTRSGFDPAPNLQSDDEDGVAIPADRMIHVYRRRSARQIRGVSWMRTSLRFLEMARELNNVQYTIIKREGERGGILLLDESWYIQEDMGGDENEGETEAIKDKYLADALRYTRGGHGDLVGIKDKMAWLQTGQEGIYRAGPLNEIIYGVLAAASALAMGLSPEVVPGME